MLLRYFQLSYLLFFFEKSLGLNVAIYALSTIALLLIFKFEFFKSNVNKTISAGFLVTSIFYYLYGSPFTLFVAVISFLLLYGLHTSIPIRNLTYALPSAFLNYFSGIGDFFNSLLSPKGQKKKHLKIFRLLRIIAFPFFLILFFFNALQYW